jgi:hypothetical protein
MLFLPVRLAPVILVFAPLFSQRIWQHAQVLLIGAILAPGKRRSPARGQMAKLSSHVIRSLQEDICYAA